MTDFHGTQIRTEFDETIRITRTDRTDQRCECCSGPATYAERIDGEDTNVYMCQTCLQAAYRDRGCTAETWTLA